MRDFEELFSEIQADMITICLEYVENRANKVYLYASCEGDIISSSFFYNINDIYVKKHKLNDAKNIGEKMYDISTERQFAVLNIINEDIEKIKELCKKYDRDMPTEFKLIYDITSGKLKAEYNYELIYTNDDAKTASSIADEWFEEIKLKKL